jgi:hypothetical protein
MYYTRVVIDFIIIVSYKTHSELTLQYLEYALYYINKTKEAFCTIYYRKGKDKGYFNFLKFYIILYYTNFIRHFSSTNSVDTSYSEVGYKYYLKVFYS